MELIDNDYFISAKEEETFNDCSYIINFINADSNVNGLTKRLDEILSYPKNIKRVGSNDKEYALSNYMWESIINEMSLLVFFSLNPFREIIFLSVSYIL